MSTMQGSARPSFIHSTGGLGVTPPAFAMIQIESNGRLSDAEWAENSMIIFLLHHFHQSINVQRLTTRRRRRPIDRSTYRPTEPKALKRPAKIPTNWLKMYEHYLLGLIRQYLLVPFRPSPVLLSLPMDFLSIHSSEIKTTKRYAKTFEINKNLIYYLFCVK